MSLVVRRVTTRGAFQALAPAWAELASQNGQTTPFLSHDWFACCWEAVGEGEQPEVLVLEESGSAVAMMPLRRESTRVRGLPVRRLNLLDCPDTPFVDMLAPGALPPAAKAVLDHFDSRLDWDILRLQRLPMASPTLKALEAEVEGRLPWRRCGTQLSPYLAIDGSWEAFHGAKSQRFKKTVRNIQNRLERLGSITIEEHRAVAPDSALFQELIALTARSWKAEHGVAIATMPRMRQFFDDLTRRASAQGWLSLWLLRLDGCPIAMEYQLQSGGVVHALRADYDLQHAAASPGSALNFAIARALFERGGIHEYDMGPGLNEYKMRWATGCHETVDLEIYRPALYPRLIHALETLVIPTARRLRERFRA